MNWWNDLVVEQERWAVDQSPNKVLSRSQSGVAQLPFALFDVGSQPDQSGIFGQRSSQAFDPFG
jgi:hypothetical protein